MLSMAAYMVIVGGLSVLLIASLSTFREGLRQKARPKGLAIVAGFGLIALLGLILILL
jgi:hypothetical protein